MKKYRHIFFDLDRTLWDFDAAAEVAFEMIFDKYNLKDLGIPSAHEFHEIYHPINAKMWELYREDKITKEFLCRERFVQPLAVYGIHDVTLADHLGKDYEYFSPRIIRLIPGTMKLLDYLKPKYHLHLITNGFQEIQHTNHNAFFGGGVGFAEGKMKNLRVGFLDANFFRNGQGVEIRLQPRTTQFGVLDFLKTVGNQM